MKKTNFLWSFFSSIKLTLVLLFLMVVVLIVSTLIPQQNAAPEFTWISNIYHSKIFYVLLVLFSLNLIICSINRLPLALKQYKSAYFPAPSGIFENLPETRIISTDKKIDDVSRMVESLLESKLAKVKKTDSGNGRLFYHEQGRFSLFGVYMVHLGVLMIIAGAVIGSIFGFEADINLAEGEEANIVQLTKVGGNHQLDFSVRCDKFMMESYDTGAPKTYRSDLSFIKNSQVIHQGSVLVNHPLTFQGIRFYQASYGLSEAGKAILTVKQAGKESREISVKEGETLDLPVRQAKATVLRVEENMMQLGPAVKLNIVTNQGDTQFWIFQHIEEIVANNPGLISSVPLFNPGLFKPLVFSLKRMERKYYTGLRVVRDPGVPLVLAGGIMLLAGIMIIFFIVHQRVWVLVEQEAQRVRISVAGRSNRYHEALQRQMDNLCVQIEQRKTV